MQYNASANISKIHPYKLRIVTFRTIEFLYTACIAEWLYCVTSTSLWQRAIYGIIRPDYPNIVINTRETYTNQFLINDRRGTIYSSKINENVTVLE